MSSDKRYTVRIFPPMRGAKQMLNGSQVNVGNEGTCRVFFGSALVGVVLDSALEDAQLYSPVVGKNNEYWVSADTICSYGVDGQDALKELGVKPSVDPSENEELVKERQERKSEEELRKVVDAQVKAFLDEVLSSPEGEKFSRTDILTHINGEVYMGDRYVGESTEDLLGKYQKIESLSEEVVECYSLKAPIAPKKASKKPVGRSKKASAAKPKAKTARKPKGKQRSPEEIQQAKALDDKMRREREEKAALEKQETELREVVDARVKKHLNEVLSLAGAQEYARSDIITHIGNDIYMGDSYIGAPTKELLHNREKNKLLSCGDISCYVLVSVTTQNSAAARKPYMPAYANEAS